MCSNDVLKERIDNLTKNMEQFHKDFKDFAEIERSEHEKIFKRFEELDNKYPTRREFNAVKWVWWLIVWVLSWLSTVIALFHK